MEHKELISLLYPQMQNLGYQKVDEFHITLPMKEIVITSVIVRRAEGPRFDIVLAVIFIHKSDSLAWNKFKREDAKMESTLYELLLNMGESAEYLDKLFYNVPNDTTMDVIEKNLPVIFELYKNKVLPYFEKWNDYSWLIENFEMEIFLKTFDAYFDIEDCIEFFKLQLRTRQSMLN